MTEKEWVAKGKKMDKLWNKLYYEIVIKGEQDAMSQTNVPSR
jgi:hypothetical protein